MIQANMEENMNLKGRSFLKLKDFTSEEIKYLIELSADLKAKKKKGAAHDVFKGKNIALIFEKVYCFSRPGKTPRRRIFTG